MQILRNIADTTKYNRNDTDIIDMMSRNNRHMANTADSITKSMAKTDTDIELSIHGIGSIVIQNQLLFLDQGFFSFTIIPDYPDKDLLLALLNN